MKLDWQLAYHVKKCIPTTTSLVISPHPQYFLVCYTHSYSLLPLECHTARIEIFQKIVYLVLLKYSWNEEFQNYRLPMRGIKWNIISENVRET